MSAKTDFAENGTLTFWLRPGDPAPSRPSALFVGLLTSLVSGEAGAATEVAGGSYARQPVTFSAPSGGAVSNTAKLTFPVATADWGIIQGGAVFDAATGGRMLYFAGLASNRVIAAGDQLTVQPGAFTVTEA